MHPRHFWSSRIGRIGIVDNQGKALSPRRFARPSQRRREVLPVAGVDDRNLALLRKPRRAELKRYGSYSRLSAALRLFLGFGDADTDRPALVLAFFQQSVGYLDRLQAHFRGQVAHRGRIITFIPRHRVTVSIGSSCAARLSALFRAACGADREPPASLKRFLL